jgi:type III pantothenate kinase
MLLADIGNTRVHIYDGDEVVHLLHEEAIELYANKNLFYITVKHQLKYKLEYLENWTNISAKMILENSYSTMGIDRRALCLSHQNGIFVSAGSAITVDVVEEGVYMGGFLLPGLKAYLNAYADISPALKRDLNKNICLTELPKTTQDAISYGIISSIKLLIEKHQLEKTLYISGGDGAWLSSFFDNALFDETLIFQGMSNALEKYNKR